MKIIAECGATKSDWRLISDGVGINQVLTAGINVSTMSMDAVKAVVDEALVQLCPGTPVSSASDNALSVSMDAVTDVHLYVAGVVTEKIEAVLKSLLVAPHSAIIFIKHSFYGGNTRWCSPLGM